MKKEEIQKEELSKEELIMLSQMIELCTKNGLFTAKDLSTVGNLFNKVVRICQ